MVLEISFANLHWNYEWTKRSAHHRTAPTKKSFESTDIVCNLPFWSFLEAIKPQSTKCCVERKKRMFINGRCKQVLKKLFAFLGCAAHNDRDTSLSLGLLLFFHSFVQRHAHSGGKIDIACRLLQIKHVKHTNDIWIQFLRTFRCESRNDGEWATGTSESASVRGWDREHWDLVHVVFRLVDLYVLIYQIY